MILRDSSNTEIRDSPPDVKTAKEWSAEDDTDDIIASLEHRDIIGTTQSGQEGIGYSREHIATTNNCVKDMEAVGKLERLNYI